MKLILDITIQVFASDTCMICNLLTVYLELEDTQFKPYIYSRGKRLVSNFDQPDYYNALSHALDVPFIAFA